MGGPTLRLGKAIHVFVGFARVYQLVVRNVVDIVLVEESLVNDPGSVGNHLVDPTALTDGFASLGVRHGGGRLVTCAQVVRAHADQELHFGERELGLTQLQSMSAEM